MTVAGLVYKAPATLLNNPTENSVQLFFDSITGAFRAIDEDGTIFNPVAGMDGGTGLPEYANDAAAVVGGLDSGYFYKTTAAGSSVVKVVA